MSRTHHSGGEPSQRMLRVAELIRHCVADMLSRHEVTDPVLDTHVVTAPKVSMSPDLKLATVFIMPLGGKDADAVIEALDKHKKFMRGEIARKVNLKFAPEIRFKVDDSFDNSLRIDQLLRSEKVRKDLETPPET